MQYEFISSQESDSEERGGRGGGASPSPPVPDLPVLDDVDALGGRGGGASVPRGSSPGDSLGRTAALRLRSALLRAAGVTGNRVRLLLCHSSQGVPARLGR